jgi:hypothetical protein
MVDLCLQDALQPSWPITIVLNFCQSLILEIAASITKCAHAVFQQQVSNGRPFIDLFMTKDANDR